MGTALVNLYDLYGVEVDTDEPYLLIDNETVIHFESTDDGLEMISPVAALPDDSASLRQILKFNGRGQSILAADEEGEMLIAVARVADESDASALRGVVENLVATVHRVRQELSLSWNQ